MEVELGRLAYAAASALVGSMATDGWGLAKTRFGRWLRKHRRGDADAVLGRLEKLREELVRARLDPDPERFWRLYEELQAALAIRIATVTADDRIAQAELDRLRAEWLALPGVEAQEADSAARLTRVYGDLLVEPRAGGNPSVFARSADLAAVRVANLAPPTTSRFIDREELIERLRTRMTGHGADVRIVNLCGEGGIGKTALALKLWELVASSFPHGLLYVDLRGTTGEGALEPGSALERFLRALGVEAARVPGDEHGRLDLFRSLTAELDLVVLLDDAASFAQVRPLISASRSSLTIVTSRDPLRGLVEEYGALVVPVPPLDDANSLKLLRAVAGLDDPDAVALPGAELEARVRRCSGIPIAVCIEAARLAVGETEASGDPEPEHAAGGGPDLLAGYRDLPPEAVRLHRLVSAHPWPSITAGSAAAVAGVDEQAAASMLRLLFEANLLERAPGGNAGTPRYRVHDRVREEVVRRITTVGDASEVFAAIGAVVRWHLAFAVDADWQVIPRWHLGPLYGPLDECRRAAQGDEVAERASYPDRNAALAALESELDNLVEAVRAASRHQLHDLASQLCEALWSVFFRRGHYQEWVAVHRLGIESAIATGDLRMQARLRVQLGFGLMGQDRLAEAADEFELASVADRAAGHDQGLATALESLGLLHLRREEFGRAAESLREARIAAERVGNPRALALLDHHSGRALSGLGRFAEAEEHFESAIAVFQAPPVLDPYNKGRVLMSRAEAALRGGGPERAERLLAEAAGIMEAEDSVIMQAQIAVLQAWCARESGDLAAERGYLVTAQELHSRAGSRLAPRVGERITFLDAASGRLS